MQPNKKATLETKAEARKKGRSRLAERMISHIRNFLIFIKPVRHHWSGSGSFPSPQSRCL